MDTCHTAHYLVSSFLKSSKSKHFDIDAQDVAILYTISTYLDMSKRSKCCFANRETLSEELRISTRRLSPRLKKLCSLKLLAMEKSWKSNHYSLGEIISGGDYLSDDKTSYQTSVRGQNVPSSGDETSLDHRTKRPMTIDYKNKIIKNRLYTPSLTLPHSDQAHDLHSSSSSEKEKEKKEENLSTGSNAGAIENENHFTVEFVTEAEQSATNHYPQFSKTLHASRPTSDNLYYRHNQNNLLRFTSPLFEEFYKIHPNPGSKKKAALIWQQENLEEIGKDIVDNVRYRLDNDAKWARNISDGNSHFIPQTHTYLANESWHDKIITIGEIEHAKDNRRFAKTSDTHQFTPAERLREIKQNRSRALAEARERDSNFQILLN